MVVGADVRRLLLTKIKRKKTPDVVSYKESVENCIIDQLIDIQDKVAVVYRQAGDSNILVEYGPLLLD